MFGELLCLSHEDTRLDEGGHQVPLTAGMNVTVFEEDLDDEGQRDDLVARGVVERSPDWLACKGSRWVLRIDSDGIRHMSELTGEV